MTWPWWNTGSRKTFSTPKFIPNGKHRKNRRNCTSLLQNSKSNHCTNTMIRAANMVCCAIKVNPPSAVRTAQSTKIPHLPLLECTYVYIHGSKNQMPMAQMDPNGKWPKWPNDLSGSDLWVYYQPPKHRKLRSYSMLFWIGISNHSFFLGQFFWVIPTLWPWNITLWHKNKRGWLENPRTKWKCHWSLEKHIYEWIVHCHIGWFIMIFYIITA